ARVQGLLYGPGKGRRREILAGRQPHQRLIAAGGLVGPRLQREQHRGREHAQRAEGSERRGLHRDASCRWPASMLAAWVVRTPWARCARWGAVSAKRDGPLRSCAASRLAA